MTELAQAVLFMGYFFLALVFVGAVVFAIVMIVRARAAGRTGASDGGDLPHRNGG